MSQKYILFLNISFTVESVLHRQLIKLMCLVKVQLTTAQCHFDLRNSMLVTSAFKMSLVPKTKVNNNKLKAVMESGMSQSTCELVAHFDVSIPTIVENLPLINKIKKLDR